MAWWQEPRAIDHAEDGDGAHWLLATDTSTGRLIKRSHRYGSEALVGLAPDSYQESWCVVVGVLEHDGHWNCFGRNPDDWTIQDRHRPQADLAIIGKGPLRNNFPILRKELGN